jgi:arginyl-tRNA synthetase
VNLFSLFSQLTLVKSDGSSMYLSRDLGAVLHRVHGLNCQRLIYVVDQGQANHLLGLFQLARRAGVSEEVSLEHVKFGRVEGMSSRRGNVVLLADVLDEATRRAEDAMRASFNTKISEDDPEWHKTAEQLGISAVLVNDLRQRRGTGYEFSWERALREGGDTGVSLQYAHCRLHSLLKDLLPNDAKHLRDTLAAKGCTATESLREPEAVSLALRMSSMDLAVRDAYVNLEPCHIAQYLFKLTKDTSRALRALPVVDAGSDDVRHARALLFAGAKEVLAEGMRLLGIQPLRKM